MRTRKGKPGPRDKNRRPNSKIRKLKPKTPIKKKKIPSKKLGGQWGETGYTKIS